jgi:hypothetical protein
MFEASRFGIAPAPFGLEIRKPVPPYSLDEMKGKDSHHPLIRKAAPIGRIRNRRKGAC